MIWMAVAVVMVGMALFFLSRRSHDGEHEGKLPRYQRAQSLFTPAERSFFGVLQQAVGGKALVLGKVRVADVVEPEMGLNRSARQKAFNRISAKHFDFLLCDKEDLSVACAIELNDASHSSKHRHERDEFLKVACGVAGVPLIQVPAKPAYVISEVRGLLPRYLTSKDTPDQEPSPASANQKAENNGKVCPRCSSGMVRRVAKKGNHAGKQFWACSAYPKCKMIEPISA